MKVFKNFNDFTSLMLNVDLGITESLDKILDETQRNIKARHGRYPTDIKWPSLKPSTLRLKRANTPLRETSELANSYKKIKLKTNEGSVESQLRKALWMEFGFISKSGSNTPARPVALPEAKKAEVYAEQITQQELKESLTKKLS